MRWSETLGHQMLDEHGKPTAPVIHYVGHPEPDVACKRRENDVNELQGFSRGGVRLSQCRNRL